MGQDKFRDDWNCDGCGETQSKHNMYYDGLCERCNFENLTADEHTALEPIILRKSFEIKRNHGLQNISGGFCNIEYVSCDADEIQYIVKFGTSSDAGRTVYTAYLTLDRNTLEEVNFIISNDPPEIEIPYFTHNDENLEGATMGAGQIQATYKELVALFGEPKFTDEDDIKTEVEWMVYFADGELGLIYDWKVCYKYLGENCIPIEQVEEWEVGSKTGSYVFRDRIQELIQKNRK